MTIEAQFLTLIKQVIDLRRQEKSGRLRALRLAYPDLLVTRFRLESLFSTEVVEKLPLREDAGEVWAWHGFNGSTTPLYDTLPLFEVLDIDAEVIDNIAARGVERIVDVKLAMPSDLEGQFDLVIGTGTCEHCFDVAQAFTNSRAAVAEGGFLVHAAPLTRVNHGFWNFSPTVYPDFLHDNGFKIIYMKGMHCDLANGFKPFDVQAHRRFNAPENAAIFVVAKRLEVRPFTFPVEHKYRISVGATV